MRAKRSHLLYHGTLLVEFPLELITACLRTPPRQPDYRQGRPHSDFVTNLHVPTETLRRAVIRGWQAQPDDSTWPEVETQQLADQRYRNDDWNYRF
jgi:lipoate-protein ligase A